MQKMRRVRTVFILIRHYDHLPNVVFSPLFSAKTDLAETWTLLDP